MKTSIIIFIQFFSLAFSQQDTDSHIPLLQGRIEPIERFVTVNPIVGGVDRRNSITLERDQLKNLRIVFLRDSLIDSSGPQFVKIKTIVKNKSGNVIFEYLGHAVTFNRFADSLSEFLYLKKIANEVSHFGYVRPTIMNSVGIQTDSLPDWSTVAIVVEPDESLHKYGGRIRTRKEFHYLVKGNRFETGFTLSAPKVLYDTRASDTVKYGNTSAMVRLYLLDGNSGERFPLNIGIGTFGVESPIDISKNGGGFAISLFFDLIQTMNYFGMSVTNKVNAGFDISPFFPVGHKSRLLFNVRLGITP